MTISERQMRAAEDRWWQVSREIQDSIAPTETLVKREQRYWDALVDLKDEADQCYTRGCRVKVTDHTRCLEHRA